MATVGIIAGTGFYSLPALEGNHPRKISTVYGDALITPGNWNGVPIEFVTRHGVDHSVPPSKVNYRANIQALKDLGVTKVLAVNVVGSVDPKLAAGDLQIITDFIDFTSGRENTFFDGVQPGGGLLGGSQARLPYTRALPGVGHGAVGFSGGFAQQPTHGLLYTLATRSGREATRC